MSGGSWQYVFSTFKDVADKLQQSESLKRRLLGKLINEISIAMYAVEWEDSGDSSDSEEAITKVLKMRYSDIVKSDIEAYIRELRELVE